MTKKEKEIWNAAVQMCVAEAAKYINTCGATAKEAFTHSSPFYFTWNAKAEAGRELRDRIRLVSKGVNDAN